LDQLTPAIKANANEISRSEEIRRLAEWIGVQEDLLRSHLAKGGTRAAQDLQQEVQQRKLDRPPAAEQGLVRCLLEKPDLGDRVRQRDEALTWLTDPRVRAWTERLLAWGDDPQAGGRFALDTLEQLAAGDSADEALLREILMAEEDYSDPECAMNAILDRLERDWAKRRLLQITKAFSDTPQTELPDDVAQEILRLGRLIHRLPD
jgi:DNA primase